MSKIDILEKHYHSKLKGYSTVEELMYKAIDDHDEKLINSFEKIFSYIHGVIILEFRKDDIFLSSSV
ncbi:MAG: hypothetical protein KAZ87_08715, partial [Spirochaetes bacterium]|nr:hypothetical protein [Spirochaetota bacterium]